MCCSDLCMLSSAPVCLLDVCALALRTSRMWHRSKLANVLFTYELARRLPLQANVTVNALHPGIVQTELSRCAARLFP